MSKEAGLRAMREARDAERRARTASAGSAGSAAAARAKAPVAPPAQARPRAETASADVPVATGDALCGHRSMNGRSCTREQGHEAKNHRYS